MTIQSLINKQDTFEIVRDKIAQILANETASQQALATADAKDPNLWKLRIFLERSNPWEQFLNDQTDQSPIVNVLYDNSTYDPGASDLVKRQKTEGIYNIDCYGFAESEDVPAGGHLPGDREAALVVHRALRLVRNILMASIYTKLELKPIVWGRWINGITVFRPEAEGRAIQQVVGARIAFKVTFNEYSPQFEAEDVLKFVSTEIKRAEDDSILAEIDFDFS